MLVNRVRVPKQCSVRMYGMSMARTYQTRNTPGVTVLMQMCRGKMIWANTARMHMENWNHCFEKEQCANAAISHAPLQGISFWTGTSPCSNSPISDACLSQSPFATDARFDSKFLSFRIQNR
mmetsp:Transcript_63011/g.124574  ORF Transcript_63011/g.124574 Transcript_63011/m.124574 type:complete len:122 (-) Transcript_63011:873-1238(-)